MGKSDQPAITIAKAINEFLEDQKSRISRKTFSKYQSIIDLYKSYLESYWPGHDGEYAAITATALVPLDGRSQWLEPRPD